MISNYYYFNVYLSFGLLFFCNSPLLLSSQEGEQSTPEFYGLSHSSEGKESSCDVVQWMASGLAKVACNCVDEEASDVDERFEDYKLNVSVQDRINKIELGLQQQNKK